MSNQEPVIVIHGVANRDQAGFEQTVAQFNQDIDASFKFLPVYWGDLAANETVAQAALPPFDKLFLPSTAVANSPLVNAGLNNTSAAFNDNLPNVAEEFLIRPTKKHVGLSPQSKAEFLMEGARETLQPQAGLVSPIGNASLSSAVNAGNGGAARTPQNGGSDRTTEVKAQALQQAYLEELPKTKYFQYIDDADTLRELGARLGDLLQKQADGEIAEQAALEIEAKTAPADGDAIPASPFVNTGLNAWPLGKAFDSLKDLAGYLIHTVDAVAGTVLNGVGSSVNSIFRNTLLPGFARLVGDVFVYQRRRRRIQRRIWDAIEKYAAETGTQGWGSAQSPINVLAHSLGALVTFDAAVSDVSPLHIKHFVTFGSQPAFFHLIDPRIRSHNTDPNQPPQGVTRLPATIGDWTSFWEPMDLLAFLAEPTFMMSQGNARPRDIRIRVTSAWELDQSSYWTHSCYWTHPEVHTIIRGVLNGTS